jgi:Pyrimidine dimer DNA glycosylase
MNIFATHSDPRKCAKFLDNKRLVKMNLETAQLLSNAIYLNDGKAPYKPTHLHHPCTLWAADNYTNYKWLYKYFVELLDEYTHRFGKIHACSKHLSLFKESLNLMKSSNKNIILVNCTEFKYIKDTHLAYRYALKLKWALDKKKPRWGKN